MQPRCDNLAAAGLAVFLATLAAPPCANAAGYSPILVDWSGTSLEGGVWYPSDATGTAVAFGPYLAEHVPEAPPKQGTRHPLVVLSHGNGGWFGSHHTTAVALADAGFVVAAVNHAGDSVMDEDGRGLNPLVARPAQLIALIDHMTNVSSLSAIIDPDRIGAFGFSAGAYTVLAAATGTPDMVDLQRRCATDSADADCAVFQVYPSGKLEPPAKGDARLRSVFLAAPALGRSFAASGLEPTGLPVAIWAAGADELLDPEIHAMPLVEALAPRDLVIVDKAGHFSFMPPCTAALRDAAPGICADPPGFDRPGFHTEFNRNVVSFFDETL